ncbi:hypothetical protein [Pseudomonas cremoricolorata]|uniref:hypothetical protein n=1 Tax=Pseudomonas cremoricolorata TaxID=157783 RepID=UPI0012B5F4D5|nr:hypothetical protein [Pseudomonas cremoricolorata]
MRHTVLGALLLAFTALSLSGCFGSEQEKQAQQESSDNLWNITPPDESKDKGFTP